MTIETNIGDAGRIQSLAGIFPKTDWLAAVEWAPRFIYAGGWFKGESLGISVLGKTAKQVQEANAILDEAYDIFDCGGALGALALHFEQRSIRNGGLQ